MACGDGMFIVQTSFRPTYWGWASDGRAWFNGWGEQGNLWGNQGLCVGAYGGESQQFVYSAGKAEMWYYWEGKLQFAEIGRFQTAEMPAGEGRCYYRGIEIFQDDLKIEYIFK